MIDVKIQSDTRDLETLLSKLKNPRPALVEIGRMLQGSTRDRLQKTKVGPDGKPWAPWALSTLLARTRKGNAGRGLLNDTGNLSRGITFEVRGNTVTVGAQATYAQYLQNGTDRMPARPFVGVSKQDEKFIDVILRRHLQIR